MKLGYPAVFKFIDPQGQAFYGTLDGFTRTTSNTSQTEQLSFSFNQQRIQLEPGALEKYWQGGALVFWQAHRSKSNQAILQIDEDSELTSIQWLESKLSEQQQRPERSLRSLDAQLKNQLKQYQRQHGLTSDSGADSRTLMLLSNTVSQGQPIFKQ